MQKHKKLYIIFFQIDLISGYIKLINLFIYCIYIFFFLDKFISFREISYAFVIIPFVTCFNVKDDAGS